MVSTCNDCGAETPGHKHLCSDCRADRRQERKDKKVCKECGAETRGRLRICSECRKKKNVKESYEKEKDFSDYSEDADIVSGTNHKNFSKRAGGFLERTIANIFSKVGFEVSLNSREFGFEADVIAKKDNFTILIEAKQYDNSYINIGSLLHEWSSKGRNAGANKTLVVIAGIKIPAKFHDIADELGIYLWEEDIVIFGKDSFYIDSDYIRGQQNFKKPSWFSEALSCSYRFNSNKKDFFN